MFITVEELRLKLQAELDNQLRQQQEVIANTVRHPDAQFTHVKYEAGKLAGIGISFSLVNRLLTSMIEGEDK